MPELFVDLLPSEGSPTCDREIALLRSSLPAFRSAMIRRMFGKALLTKADLVMAARGARLKRLAREAAQRRPDAAVILPDFVASPRDVLGEFCEFVETFFEGCLAEEWERLESQAIDDAAFRNRLLRRFGVAAMLRTLTNELAVDGNGRTASVTYGGPESAGTQMKLPSGATLALTPSYFIWPHATFVVYKSNAALDVRIAYPLASPALVRVRARHWGETAKRFAAVSDATRLRMLELLGQRDLSTREFAGLLDLSESAISRHLSILRKAALVTSVRDGYFVLYRRASGGLQELLERIAGLA